MSTQQIEALRDLIATHAQPGTSRTAIPRVLVSRIVDGGASDGATTGTVLALVAQGTKRMTVGGEVHDYGPGQYLIASVDLPVSGRFQVATEEFPALGFGLEIRAEVVAELMLSAAAADFMRQGRDDSAPAAVAVGDASDRLLDAVIRMLRLLDNPRDIQVLAPLIEREILWLVMAGEQGAALRQLGIADSSLSRVRHVVRWVREHFADSIRVDELATLARMSPSAFHRAFHAVTAMSPIQYQKSIRLQEARLRVLAHPGDVTGIAYAVGYESPSQFSREYKRAFGVPPSQDVVAVV